MVNVNILNKLIDGISKQIPLVHSYYTQSPYDVWNTKEIEYGSVSFVITKINTRESSTTYDATLYYADRLLEDNSNIDSVHSDAATVIQTIVGALNQSDEYLEVSYPVGITLFEQDFCDKLAGGYAQFSISTSGMGECFVDEFTVPEIVGTSAYFTKEEITELFPLRTDLSTVAYTGSFNDLKDKPDLVNQSQYDELLQAVLDTTGDLAKEINSKVSSSYFSEWSDGIETDIKSKASNQTVDTLREDILDHLETLRNTLNSKVNNNYFETVKASLEASINDSPTGQEFNAALNAIDNLTISLDSKVDKQTFNNVNETIDSLQTQVNSKIDRQVFDNLYDTIETVTTNLAVEIKNKVSHETFELFKESVKDHVTQQQYDNLLNAVLQSTGELAKQIEQKVSLTIFNAALDEIESKIKDTTAFVTYDTLNSVISEVTETLNSKVNNSYFEGWKSCIEEKLDNTATKSELNEVINDLNDIKTKDLPSKVNKQDFDNFYEAVEDATGKLAYEISTKVSTSSFSPWKSNIENELSERVTKQIFYNTMENIYTKDEIEAKLSVYELAILKYLNTSEFKELVLNFAKDVTEEYLATALDYYTKEEIDVMLSNLSLDDYYTKSEVDTKISNVEVDLSDYYTKSQVDTKIANAKPDLSNYYNKSQIDAEFNKYRLKSDSYSKSEIDATIGNINTILNNVLYVK